ncbi:short-chain dehydrogenase [Crepidotus variabilis]|uniref:Short-chain dehydrogenase n=1 Tax=Crepidotus variabilis TaxID=179855 RepID=A0A9P6E4L5_9AGAR|nr:short-chain dehydrogenase [Crepidotus variabilis]
MKPSLIHLLYLQFSKPPPVPRIDLAGKNVVVIGASTGIGLEAAKHFATMNPARLILGCRDATRGEAAAARIVRETEFKNVEVWLIDLTDFASVSAFAERYETEGGRLDILVENAAIIPTAGQKMTKDGWEPTLQTNNLATSLLGLLLVPRMLETAEKFRTLPRLVVVASGLHYLGKLEDRVVDAANPFQVLGAENYYDFNISKNRTARYTETKILNVLFARALASRIEGKSVVVNSVDPGYCKSELRRSYQGIFSFTNWLMDTIFALTSEQGSRQLIWASVGRTPGDEEIDLNGTFISFMSVWEPSDFVVDEKGQKIQEKHWENLVEELEKVNPKVRQIVDQYLSH